MSASATKKASKKGGAAARPRLVKTAEPKEDLRVVLGRGAEGMRLAQGYSRALRGRPKKGTTATGTSTRTIRLPEPVWEALDAIAKGRGMSTHGAMREAIVQWLARAGAKR